MGASLKRDVQGATASGYGICESLEELGRLSDTAGLKVSCQGGSRAGHREAAQGVWWAVKARILDAQPIPLPPPFPHIRVCTCAGTWPQAYILNISAQAPPAILPR